MGFDLYMMERVDFVVLREVIHQNAVIFIILVQVILQVFDSAAIFETYIINEMR